MTLTANTTLVPKKRPLNSSADHDFLWANFFKCSLSSEYIIIIIIITLLLLCSLALKRRWDISVLLQNILNKTT